MIVSAVGQIGCIPYQLARYHGNDSRCNEKINSAISLFNSGLRKLVDRFNGGELRGAKFVFLDSYQSTSDLYLNATSYGNFHTEISNHKHETIVTNISSHKPILLGYL